ncbi:OmpA family protein [Actinomycetospora straminea]|uniref:OmpA family protein n=1 Tax=Actinomycetospora straminea TaxID=663607 RepID=UPI002366C02C|nr:OmpA family protein [Actinomycetospora straminea]MDD7933351.1 OmpA family protein [Actinomycetospora straminea]
MTGGGLHRGRVTGGPHTGAHWWGGRGPAGGGSHAAPGARRRLRVLLLLLGLLALGGVAVAVAVTGTSDPPPAPAASPAPDGPAVPAAPALPAASGTPATSAAVVPDADALQDTIDDVLAATPLRFPPDSARPADGADEAVERLAGALRAAPGPPVTIEGHTAPTGEDTDDAEDLSQRRADEIVRRLQAAGVPAGSLTAVGVGSERPRDSLAASRRVEVRVTD